MITFQHFTYKYPRGSEPMLRDVNLQVNKGEFLLITGCSGAGKTTLCRAMFGALHHDIGGDFEGSVTLNGRDIKEYTIGDIGKFMGVVFDDPESQLFMPLVEDEIKFGLQARNMPAGKDDIIKGAGPGRHWPPLQTCASRAVRRPEAESRHCGGTVGQPGDHAVRRAYLST